LGYNVVAIPGPAAFLTALVASGLPTDSFCFLGFVNNKKNKLINYKTLPATLIFYEAPHRLLKTLKTLEVELGDREVVVARELTKKFETYYFGRLSNIVSKIEKLKGEFVILVAPATVEEQISQEFFSLEIERLREKKIRDSEIKEIIKEKYNLSRNQLYDLFLKKK
jgi:16S rRNA (cytidine1402-2'-O)-methyltransferase